MHLLNIPIILLLPLSLLPIALSSTSSASSPPQQTSLTLHIPSTIPALHHSTRAFLTTHSGFSLIAPLTRAQTFVFNNLTLNSGSESYNLDIGSREYDFAPMVVVVREGDNKGRKIEVLRRGGVGEVKRREEGGWEIRVIKARDGWDERSGCMGSPLFFYFTSWRPEEFCGTIGKNGILTNFGVLLTVNPMSLLKNPMILLGLVGFAFVIGMPYLLDTSTSPPPSLIPRPSINPPHDSLYPSLLPKQKLKYTTNIQWIPKPAPNSKNNKRNQS